jgi:hypothetical protein
VERVKIFFVLAILTGSLGMTSSPQFVGDCPASNWDHPIWVKSVVGVVTDASGAVIPKVQIVLQAKKGKTLVDVEEIQTDSMGKFSSRAHQTGEYRLLVAGPKGFCKVSLPVWISGKGWSGFTLTLPVTATDTCQAYCDERARIEEVKPKL